ncbi:MAG: M15 family metallopeptidase [Candidatus Promineifilaceae bacterium]|nr:M15 family metallopeptidase [Candidatus Promineifilaceae bacterium]
MAAKQTPIPISTPPFSPTPIPSSAPTQIANTATTAPSPTPSPIPTETPIGTCDQRLPGNDLLAIVTLDYDISRDFKPDDLVLLTDVLPMSVTLGYPTKIRGIVLEPLLALIEDMQGAGLSPRIISGYRSYAAQSIAWNKWNKLYPEHASIISAPPGHSEHQLGTAIDFGSPELADIVGQEDIEFHTLFYKTSEGQWLVQNAHKYGFTLSYPMEAFELTGFYYEPWHYRFVGVEMAAKLYQEGLSLTEHQLSNNNQPCIP